MKLKLEGLNTERLLPVGRIVSEVVCLISSAIDREEFCAGKYMLCIGLARIMGSSEEFSGLFEAVPGASESFFLQQ